MTVPSVIQHVTNGPMLPSSGGKIMAIVGCSPNGPLNTPMVLSRTSDVQKIFGSGTVGSGPQGKLVELACRAIQQTRASVMLCRAQTSTAGTCGSVVTSATGTSVPTVATAAASPGTAVPTGAPVTDPATFTAGGTPTANASVVVKFTATVTTGTDAVKYQYSIDGGATWTPVLTMPVGTYTIVVPEVNWTLAVTHASGANKIAAGETVAAQAAAPSPLPVDDFEVVIKCTRALSSAGATLTYGTVATDKLYWQMSLDNGATWGVEYTTGTSSTMLLPDNYGGSGASDVGSVSLTLAAGTVYPGDTYSFRTTGPRWSTGYLTTAMSALALTSTDWEQCQLAECVSDAEASPSGAWAVISLLSSAISSMAGSSLGSGRYRYATCSLRVPLTSEDDSDYQAYCATVRAEGTSEYVAVGAGSCKLSSAVSGRLYRRGVTDAVGAIQQSLSEEQSSACLVNVPGGLPGVSIVDSDGNLDDHDEALEPGLDDMRFVTLRSWSGRSGAYVTQDRMYSQAGSPLYIIPVKRVFNLFQLAIDVQLAELLMAALQADPKTGFLAEPTLAAIDSSVLSAIDALVMAPHKASGRSFRMSRNDDVSTRTFTGVAKLVTLAYPETFVIEVGITKTL